MVEGMESIVVTVSGYHGAERLKLIRFINHAAANYVGKMSRSVTHLICWRFKGRKYELAKKFGTIVINHRWLEDCFKKGKRIQEQPYTSQSGKEVGFIANLPVLRETVLTENKLQSKTPNMFHSLNDVIDLDSDDIENDDSDDWLLDENLFPRPGSRQVAPQRSKRKLVRKTLLEDWQPMTNHNHRRSIREPQIPTIDRCQENCFREGSSNNHVGMRTDSTDSSRRSRRLVRKNAERNINGSATVDVEQQSRRETDICDLSVAPNVSDSSIDLRDDIEANISTRLEITSPSYDGNRDNNVYHSNYVDTLGDSALQGTNTSCSKGTSSRQTSPNLDNSNLETHNRKLLDHSTRLPTSVELSCVICWTEFSPTRGVLPCGHRFCFGCIQSWADCMASNRKESTCPLCKVSFASITRVDAASMDQQIYSQTVPDPSSTQDIFIVPEGGAGLPENEIPPQIRQSVCFTCQSPYPEDLLIYCQMCRSSCVHSYCLDPPLFPWTCNTCRDGRPFYHY